MDNISPKLFDDPSFTIYLTETQFQQYQTKCLHLNAPDGRYPESVGHNVQEDNVRMSKTQLREQIALITALLCNIHTEIELPQDAVLGLADLMSRLSANFKVNN